MLIGRRVPGLVGGASLTLCALLPACQSKDAATHRDVGSACVALESSEPVFFDQCQSQELAAGSALRIDVDFALCLSSSCDRLVRADCEVTRDGTVITVTARADVESEVGGSCTDDCGSVNASCTLGELPEGSYELRYGDATLTFDVPSTTSVRCAGRGFGPRCCDDASDCGAGICQENRCGQ